MAVWGNPMARGPDRLEAAAVLVAVVIWILAVPIVATGGTILWQQVSTDAAQQARTRTKTVATLDAEPPGPVIGAYGVPARVEAAVPAHWLATDGTVRSGSVTVGSDAGDAKQVPVWLDRAGNPVAPPIDTTAAAVLVVFSSVGAWLSLGVLLGTGWLVLRWRLNRRRLCAWDRDWALVEPIWSGR